MGGSRSSSTRLVWIVSGAALAEGSARRESALGPLEVIARAPLAIGDDVAEFEQPVRDQLALYIGGMGSRRRNFYKDLVSRYGFEQEADEIQDCSSAATGVRRPRPCRRRSWTATCLVGTEDEVQRRLDAFAAAGATLVNVVPLHPDLESRVRDLTTLRELRDVAPTRG